jgi:hypothetical protein
VMSTSSLRPLLVAAARVLARSLDLNPQPDGVQVGAES